MTTKNVCGIWKAEVMQQPLGLKVSVEIQAQSLLPQDATGLLPHLVGSPKPAAHPAPAPCHQAPAFTRSPPSASLSAGPGAYMTLWYRRTPSSPRLEVVRDRQRFQFVFMGSSWLMWVCFVSMHSSLFLLFPTSCPVFQLSFPNTIPADLK